LSIGFSKLLICGRYSPSIDTCEVIDLESSETTCKIPQNFPATVYGAIGGLGYKENPIICGGRQNSSISNSCYSLENSDWVSSVIMNSVRYASAAAQLGGGKLLVTGGFNGSAYLNSAEMVNGKEWESNIPSLAVTIAHHCMVTVNLTTVMVIDGYQNSKYSGKTFFFTLGEERWTEGPELKYKRIYHRCGKIRRDKDSQEMSIIVSGGYDGSSYLSSVEILHESSNEWQTGPELPFGIGFSQIVEDQNGGVVLIGGESSSIGNLDTLYQLPHGGQDALWTKMEQKLKTGRRYHTAILVPENIVDCS
jgi:hypothetical protein